MVFSRPASGRMSSAVPSLKAQGIHPIDVPVITRDQVEHAKPDPDLFIAASDQGVDVAAALLSGTASGIFWLRAAPACSAPASSRAITAGKNSSAREHIACTRTRWSFSVISMGSASADKRRHGVPNRLETE
jgi:hypothetical protein